ncbi:MAG: ribonuclease HII [Patescibacteria group bacterium]|nr:ribonuclease HII [Patescibacteria group bacterium]
MKFPGIRKARRSPLLDEYRFIGVDEAGRGPVIGPMVIAICALTARDKRWCAKHGVTDSKMVTPKRRDLLAAALRDRCWYKVAIIEPPEIDEAVTNRSITLNGLEIKHMAQLIKDYQTEFPGSPAEIMLDAPVRSLNKFRRLLSHLSGWENIDTLKAENKADSHHRHVGAASIIAKSIRDSHIRKVIYELGYNIGSGYSSDKLARNYVAQAKPGDPHIRWSWATCKNLRIEQNESTKSLL